MRIRSVVAIGLVLLPAGLSAQRLPRLPRIGGHRPGEPTPMGPQPPAIARELAYKRSRVSVESYPLITYSATPTVGGNVLAKRTNFGAGTRADYRVARRLSITFDGTSSLPNGASTTETAELGVRLRPERNDRKVYPFLDLRAGYVHAYDEFLRPFDVANGFNGAPGYGSRYSQGVGAVGGAGIEYALTRRFSLTGGASVLRSRMTSYNVYGAAPATGRYLMTTYRFTLGLRYNPVHLITALEQNVSQH